jgi:hypothetical protein
MTDAEDFIKSGRPHYLYTYSTEHLLPKDKVRFYYALKGRDGKSGIVKEFKVEHVGRTVLIADEKQDEDVLQFFKVWNLPYTRRRIIADDTVQRGGPP